jgi:carboxylesterase type B
MSGPFDSKEMEHALAAGIPTFMYIFAYEPPILRGLLGACHAADCPFIFGTVDRIPFAGYNPDRFEMSAVMGAAWASFARTGPLVRRATRLGRLTIGQQRGRWCWRSSRWW